MVRNTSSVSPKGQVTIPIEIREEFGISPRDKVLFKIQSGRITLEPLGSPVDRLYGSVPPLNPPISWDEIQAIIREEVAANAASEGLEPGDDGR